MFLQNQLYIYYIVEISKYSVVIQVCQTFLAEEIVVVKTNVWDYTLFQIQILFDRVVYMIQQKGVILTSPHPQTHLHMLHSTHTFTNLLTHLTCLVSPPSEGFSIFLYGLGSKKMLMSHFQQQYLANFDHIVVNGFFPSLTLKNVSIFLKQNTFVLGNI